MLSRRPQNPRIRAVSTLLPLALALCLPLVGCGLNAPTTLGAQPTGKVVSVSEVVHSADTKAVTLRGEMIEKCPVAGCWFKLRDKTGVIRIDTKAAGFVVTDVPLHTQMTVEGKFAPGTDAQIAATGLRY